MKNLKKLIILPIIAALLCMLTACSFQHESKDVTDSEQNTEAQSSTIKEDGLYTSPEEVAEYIHKYGHLPDNFITKQEAQALGWDSSLGNLAEAAPGMSIGGDHFGNYEGLLPDAPEREYTECDVNSGDGERGAERIVFSNDGLIYYTGDHYKSFELIYGEE